MPKIFYIQQNIGNVKYIVNFHDGKKHPDGSPFFDIATFKNKLKMNKLIKNLLTQGYNQI